MTHMWARWRHNTCRLEVPNALEQGRASKVAQKRAGWLYNPCRIGDPHHFRVGDKIRNGPHVGRLAS